jgi:hypothetical protein
MRCAVIDPATGAVVNVIMADPSMDDLPGGLPMVALADGQAVDARFGLAEDGVTIEPRDPVLIAHMEIASAQREAAELAMAEAAAAESTMPEGESA